MYLKAEHQLDITKKLKGKRIPEQVEIYDTLDYDQNPEENCKQSDIDNALLSNFN